MGRSDLERLSKEELIELVLRLQRPEKTSRTSSKPPSTDRKAQRERSKPGGAKPGHEGHGLVRNNLDQPATWTVELLMDLPAHLMPPPFTVSEHHFASLEEACKWLGLSVDEVMYVMRGNPARERF